MKTIEKTKDHQSPKTRQTCGSIQNGGSLQSTGSRCDSSGNSSGGPSNGDSNGSRKRDVRITYDSTGPNDSRYYVGNENQFSLIINDSEIWW